MGPLEPKGPSASGKLEVHTLCMQGLDEKGPEWMKEGGREAPGPFLSRQRHLAYTTSEIKGSSLESDLSSSPTFTI